MPGVQQYQGYFRLYTTAVEVFCSCWDHGIFMGEDPTQPLALSLTPHRTKTGQNWTPRSHRTWKILNRDDDPEVQTTDRATQFLPKKHR